MKVYDIVAEHNALNEKGEIGKAIVKGFKSAKAAISSADDVAKAGKKGLAPTTKAAKDYKAARMANAEKFSTKGLKGADRLEQLKKLADANKAARVAATKTVNSFSTDILTLIQLGLGIDAAYDYYTRITYLEDQWKAFLAGDKHTEYFSDFDVNDPTERAAAQTVADEMRNKLLGEITILVGTNLAGASVAKGMQMFGGAVKVLGGTVGGPIGMISGAAIQRFSALASKLGKGGNVAFMAFLKTSAGKEFMNNTLVAAITGTIGSMTAKLIDEGIKALEAMGIDVPDAVKSPIAATRADNLSGENDPSNKTVYIGPHDYPVTDRTGKLLPGIENDRMVQAIRSQAKAAGQPDPLANIKR